MSKHVNLSGLTKKIKDAKSLKKKVIRPAYEYFRRITPVRTGNAANNTFLKDDTIKAQYPYADVLDAGRHLTSKGMRGSTQAPEGMSKPTIRYVKNLVEQYVRKIGRKK